MDTTAMHAHINQAAQTVGVSLNAAQIEQLIGYVQLLHKWNAAYNLSAIKDIPNILVKHLYDCLAVVAPIHQQLIHSLPTGQHTGQHTVLDVGSGAGLPGVVLAVCLPTVQVTMVDAVQKKMLFVRQAIASLGLRNAQAQGVRIQDWQGQYPVITARAWTALADIPVLTAHCLAPRGTILAMKGPRLEVEALNLPADWYLSNVLDINVPHLNEPRTLAYLSRKSEKT